MVKDTIRSEDCGAVTVEAADDAWLVAADVAVTEAVVLLVLSSLLLLEDEEDEASIGVYSSSVALSDAKDKETIDMESE